MTEIESSGGSPGVRPPVGQRVSRLPMFAAFFVMGVLVLLALVPTVIQWRFNRLLSQAEEGHAAARPRAAELLFAIERQVAALHGYHIRGEAAFLDDFDAACSEARALFRQLEVYLEPVGDDAQRQLAAAAAAAAEWKALADSLIAARLTTAEYTAHLSRLEALHGAQLSSMLAVQQQIDRAASALVEDATQILLDALLSGFVLAVLGVLALIAVGWFVRRERALSLRVAAAMDEEARLREESDRQRAELERMTESRARLMRGFTHDLKNPLGAADGYLQLLEQGLMGELGERQAHAVERSRHSLHAAVTLVEDLLALARAERGHLEIEAAPTDLSQIVSEAAEDYRAQAEAKGLELREDVPDALPTITTDGARVRQVLGNLLSNAVKYTADGRVTMRLAVPQDGRYATIDVIDTGPGIPEDQQGLLFQEFVRLSMDRRAGVGVGLAISHRIAQALGGEILVRSRPGEGSTFTLRLPVNGVAEPGREDSTDV